MKMKSELKDLLLINSVIIQSDLTNFFKGIPSNQSVYERSIFARPTQVPKKTNRSKRHILLFMQSVQSIDNPTKDHEHEH